MVFGLLHKVLGGLLLAASIFAVVQTLRLYEAKEDYTTLEANYAKAREKGLSDQLADERRHSEQLAKIAVEHRKEQERANDQFESTLAGLRTDAIRVRNRFTCPAAPVSPSAPGAPPAGAQGGLRGEDVEFLLREAKRADDITRERNEAVELLEKHRELINAAGMSSRQGPTEGRDGPSDDAKPDSRIPVE